MLLTRRVLYEAWEILERVDPRIALHWVWGGLNERTWDVDSQAQTSWRRPQNCSNSFYTNAGHLVPQQVPDQLGTSATTDRNAC